MASGAPDWTKTIEVSNTSIAVVNSGSGALSVAGSVDIGNSPAVTVTAGTVDVTQASGGVLNVGGTVNVGNTSIAVTNSGSASLSVAGTIDIGNTPAVTVSSGTVAVSSGTVNIGNSPAVTISSGTVDVTQASGAILTVGGTVNVGNTSIAVTNSGTGTLSVAGTIDIGNTPAVTVSSGTVAVSSGTVNIGNSPAVTISSGTVTIGSITAGQIIDVINSPGTIIGVGSDQAILFSSTAIAESGTLPTSGTVTLAIATIPNSAIPPSNSAPSPAHALAWATSLTMSTAAATIQWAPQLVDANGHVYLEPNGQNANGGFYINNSTQSEDVNPVGYINDGDSLTLQLVIEGASGGAYDVTGSIFVVAYTASIPPRDYIAEVGTIGGGTINEVNVIGSLPASTAQGISIADSAAPADNGGSNSYTVAANSNTTIFTTGAQAVILRSLRLAPAGATGNCSIQEPNGMASIAYNLTAATTEMISGPGWYVSPNSYVFLFSSDATTYFISWDYTTL